MAALCGLHSSALEYLFRPGSTSPPLDFSVCCTVFMKLSPLPYTVRYSKALMFACQHLGFCLICGVVSTQCPIIDAKPCLTTSRLNAVDVVVGIVIKTNPASLKHHVRGWIISTIYLLINVFSFHGLVVLLAFHPLIVRQFRFWLTDGRF